MRGKGGSWTIFKAGNLCVTVSDLCFMFVCIWAPQLGWIGLAACVPHPWSPSGRPKLMDDAWKLRNSSVFAEELYEQLLDSYRCLHTLEFTCMCTWVWVYMFIDGCCALGVILALLIRQACEGKPFNTVAESSETHTYTASSLKCVCSTPPSPPIELQTIYQV